MKLGNTMIIGDSYSTFKGYIPEGYAVYYYPGREDAEVQTVEQTWWHQLMSETDATLLLNNSWSGSTIGYTGYDNCDNSGSSSFIYRWRRLREEGFFEKNAVDTVFLFGGTNDSWCNAPLGSLSHDGADEQALYAVLPAICCFMRLVRETLPAAKVYCLVNSELKPEITEGLVQTSEQNGIVPVRLKDIEKYGGHPTIKGMRAITDQILNVLLEGNA